MEADAPTNPGPISDQKLTRFKGDKTRISIYLANGIKLDGEILDFDRESLVITSDTGPEGITITRANIATMTRFKEDSRGARQEGGQRGTSPVRQPRR